ncbi:hypothetical protein Y032_0599g483 [Ancylostoma ceylanicum]|uniref:SCP domain-containing protein n=1 Tax=Ancylostoma ceylanicum TaxID=53326 RepID=A0A016WME6_9BILA|nr:hypothetical protein Y032_0599g483 [Ancylostoma ceylanicum]
MRLFFIPLESLVRNCFCGCIAQELRGAEFGGTKNLSPHIFQEYYCALEKMAKFSVFIPGYNDQNRYDTVEFRHEEPTSTGFERLVRKSIHSWSKDFKKINGSRKIGCNYDTVNGNEALVCLVGQ